MGRVATCLLALTASAGCHGQPNLHLVPEQQTDMDPKALEEFAEEVQDYVELRGKLAGQALRPDPIPEQAAVQRRSLREAIQRARKDAKPGDFFKKDVEAAIRRIIRTEMSGAGRAALVKEIQQGNPNVEGVPQQKNPQIEVVKRVPLRVNGEYPDDAPLSSVPGPLLLKLPPLPDQVRYRFVGPHLILRDAEASMILDYLLDAIPDRSLPR